MGYMNSDTTHRLDSTSSDDTLLIGEAIGEALVGGEVIELVGDLGAGKTQLVRGIAKGAGSTDQVQSPTFTIEREYQGAELTIHHYDFYRLHDAGVMLEQLSEVIGDDEAVVIIEWSEVVEKILPEDRIRVDISSTSKTGRELIVDDPSAKIIPKLKESRLHE